MLPGLWPRAAWRNEMVSMTALMSGLPFVPQYCKDPQELPFMATPTCSQYRAGHVQQFTTNHLCPCRAQYVFLLLLLLQFDSKQS